jgi:hypothetical protein
MPKKRSNSHKDVKPVFHIFCEGKTEESYLESYIEKFYSGNRRLQVIRIENAKKNTAKELVGEAIEFQEKENCPEGDIFWVVYDRENEVKYSDKHHQTAYDSAEPKNISIAISNVCFEVWILLHFQDIILQTNSCDDAIENSPVQFKDYADLIGNSPLQTLCRGRGLSYKKGSKRLFENFTDTELAQARNRAKIMNQSTKNSADPNRTKPYQWNPYTNVHELLDAIDEFAIESNLQII